MKAGKGLVGKKGSTEIGGRKKEMKNESDQSTCMKLSEAECPQVQSQPGTQTDHQASKGYI